MKNISILLFAILYANTVLAQDKNNFKDIISVSSNQTYRFNYLNEYFELSKSKCASLYMECKLNKDFLVFQDSIKIFYKNDAPYMKGIYNNGLKNGKFTWYNKDKKIICEGNYADDIRTGDWYYYYPNGSLKKIIEYKNQNGFLREFYNEDGIKLVENGNGHYVDTILLQGYLGVCKVDGNIVEGVLDGEWNIYLKNKLIAKEYFQNKEFIKGISYSILGVQNYNSDFYSSYIESIPIEKINLKTPKTKCDLVGIRMNFNIKNDFNSILKKNYAALNSRNPLPQNYWFFAGLEFSNSDKLKNVEIFTNQENIDKNTLVDFIKNSYSMSNKANEVRDNRMLIPIVIKDNELYLSNDSEIELLK